MAVTTQTPQLSAAQILAAQSQANAIASAITPVVNSNEFVFFAAFDGTDNGANPPADGSGDSQTTAVKQLFDQVVSASGSILHYDYEPGVGTPGTLPFSAGWDVTVTAQSVINARNAYTAFAAQATAWLTAHPGGALTSMITAFSRGGAAAAIFAEMLYEYGLVNAAGQVLIQPGAAGAVSAALIIDPVLTGLDGNVDFPPNVQNLTIVQAQNEYRTDFDAANYTSDAAAVFPVLGNHGDAGDLYDNGLGGIYLQAYTSFFQNAGLNVASVPSSRAYDPTKPVVVHSESLTTSQILLNPSHFYDATYNSLAITDPNYLTVARQVVSYGTNGLPVAVTGNATTFTTQSGDIVIGGSGYNNSIDYTKLVILPNSSASIGGVGDTITVNNGATLDLTSNILDPSELIKLTQNSEIIIDTPAAFRGTIDGFVPGDTIDLAGIGTAISVTLGSSNVLDVEESNSFDLDLQLDPGQSFQGDQFVVKPDGNGGTDVTISASTVLYGPSGFAGGGAGPDGFTVTDSSISKVTGTGSETTIATQTATYSNTAAAFDSATSTLYLEQQQSGGGMHVVSFNVTNGSFSDLGSAPNVFDTFTFENATNSLFGIGGILGGGIDVDGFITYASGFYSYDVATATESLAIANSGTFITNAFAVNALEHFRPDWNLCLANPF